MVIKARSPGEQRGNAANRDGEGGGSGDEAATSGPVRGGYVIQAQHHRHQDRYVDHRDSAVDFRPWQTGWKTEALFFRHGGCAMSPVSRWRAGRREPRGQDGWLTWVLGFGTSLYQDGLRMNTDAAAYANQRSESRPAWSASRCYVDLRRFSTVRTDAGGIVNPRSANGREPMRLAVGTIRQPQPPTACVNIGAVQRTNRNGALYRVVGLGVAADAQDEYASGMLVSNDRILGPLSMWAPSQNTSLTILSSFFRDRNDGFAFCYSPPSGASSQERPRPY